MDDLTSTVNSLFMFDEPLNSPTNSRNYVTNNLASNIHPRLDAYKKNAAFYSSQAERRHNLLLEQKKKRHSLANLNRGLDEAKLASTVLNTKLTKKPQTPAIYSNQLMFSEWLEEKPLDFETDWILVVCPVGKRCLVVAMDGMTTAYTKAGKQICRHLSKLPGGSKETRTDYTILDCIFSYELQTYFILDVLVYKSHPVLDSETEFRFFWLRCKLDETTNLTSSCCGNPYKFQDLPRSLTPSMSLILDKPFDFEVDGLLFYHKEAHYMPGHSPLVLWLKAYMLPEILSIAIPEWIQSKVPGDYKGYRNAINKSNTKQKRLERYLATGANEDSGYKFKVDAGEEFTVRHFGGDGCKEENLSSMSEQ